MMPSKIWKKVGSLFSQPDIGYYILHPKNMMYYKLNGKLSTAYKL